MSDRDALDLVLRVTRTVSEHTHLGGALNDCLREICACTGWKLGEVWMPTPDRSAVTLAHIRTGRGELDPALSEFIAESETMRFAPGVGLPGRVFASGARVWIPDVETLPATEYLRLERARAAGLHAALAVPVSSAHEVLAVLLFYLDRPRPEDPRRVELVTTVAAQIGLLLRQQYTQRLVQRLEVEALATPVLRIWEDVALVPLIGKLDERRVHHLQQSTLEFLERHRSKAVLIDVTGIPDIDPSVVTALVDLARAARLLGAHAIFTGVSPSMARALVRLGISLSDFAAESTLAEGLSAALAHVQRPVAERLGLPQRAPIAT